MCLPKKKKLSDVEKLKLKFLRAKEGPLGQAVDFIKQHGDKIPELAMYAGVAWMGSKAVTNLKVSGPLEGALAGMVALKLASTTGGDTHMSIYSPLFGVDIPFNSQTVGLGMLAALGLGAVLPDILPLPKTTMEEALMHAAKEETGPIIKLPSVWMK